MVRSSRTRFCSLLLVAAFLTPLYLHAQHSACDPGLRQNLDHPQGYRDRDGQLCEGMYATGVSSLGLTLASFTGPVRDVDMASKAQLHFEWDPVGQGDVRLRADSLRPRLYYRLDAIRSAAEKNMVWVNAIPAQYGLRTSEFGVLATQKDASDKRIYLPLRIGRDGQAAARTPYLITVISATEIEEIYWSLAMAGKDGFIVMDQPLERRPYPANQPITIQLDELEAAGRYLLTISAELRSGSSDSVKIPFYHTP